VTDVKAGCGHWDNQDIRGMPELCLDCQLALLPERDPAAIAIWPVGHLNVCQGCGVLTPGDLCLDCDDTVPHPHRPIRR